MTMNRSRRLILVTGGAGFIGSHLVEGLLERGEAVRVLDNLSTGKQENLMGLGNGRWNAHRDFEFILGDIRDRKIVQTAMNGVDAVFHQAALGSVPRSVTDPVTTQEVNADGTLNILQSARDAGVSRVVYASSSSVYGNSELLPKREGEEGLTLSPYALTKRVNEEYGRLFMGLYAFETIGLRYFNVYGPRQDPESEYAAVIPRFVTALLKKSEPIIYGTGLQSRDFTFVKDVVRANILALEAPPFACGRSFNIGCGTQATLLELLSALQDLLGTNIEPRFESPRAGDVMHSSADTGLSEKMLGFKAEFDLRLGLAQSIAWYRENL
ncbi:SDR family oxidoreductase [Desulfomonile tiedjei]|uniref:Nucleoside-diphosphate-sugar epimerase n=1 Tax=Desulfomonile tiedjei (strain ATCC 49306 / DSM 6799 / DCB-1) TaxID=706587 RepID=I4C2Z8_DESTA|nr:SDR family oxidoreductase [Desulfomonile tiedjei]AFM23939.1 nucleoside-diphosphate-sugar epimerase [Desulfomonile tiedjei DSM 6799]